VSPNISLFTVIFITAGCCQYNYIGRVLRWLLQQRQLLQRLVGCLVGGSCYAVAVVLAVVRLNTTVPRYIAIAPYIVDHQSARCRLDLSLTAHALSGGELAVIYRLDLDFSDVHGTGYNHRLETVSRLVDDNVFLLTSIGLQIVGMTAQISHVVVIVVEILFTPHSLRRMFYLCSR